MSTSLNLQLADNLTISTVQSTRDRLLSQLKNKNTADISINLCNVARFDTAGLALLIDIKKVSKQHSKKINFCEVPESIKSLAEFYGVADLF